jgi:gamma-tubulin complex component 2
MYGGNAPPGKPSAKGVRLPRRPVNKYSASNATISERVLSHDGNMGEKTMAPIVHENNKSEHFFTAGSSALGHDQGVMGEADDHGKPASSSASGGISSAEPPAVKRSALTRSPARTSLTKSSAMAPRYMTGTRTKASSTGNFSPPRGLQRPSSSSSSSSRTARIRTVGSASLCNYESEEHQKASFETTGEKEVSNSKVGDVWERSASSYPPATATATVPVPENATSPSASTSTPSIRRSNNAALPQPSPVQLIRMSRYASASETPAKGEVGPSEGEAARRVVAALARTGTGASSQPPSMLRPPPNNHLATPRTSISADQDSSPMRKIHLLLSSVPSLTASKRGTSTSGSHAPSLASSATNSSERIKIAPNLQIQSSQATNNNELSMPGLCNEDFRKEPPPPSTTNCTAMTPDRQTQNCQAKSNASQGIPRNAPPKISTQSTNNRNEVHAPETNAKANATEVTPKTQNRAASVIRRYPTQQGSDENPPLGVKDELEQEGKMDAKQRELEREVELFRAEVDATCIPYNSFVTLQSCGGRNQAEVDSDGQRRSDGQRHTLACQAFSFPKKESSSRHNKSSGSYTMEFKYTAVAVLGSGIPQHGSASIGNISRAPSLTRMGATMNNSNGGARSSIDLGQQGHHGVTPCTLQMVFVKPLPWFSNTTTNSTNNLTGINQLPLNISQFQFCHTNFAGADTASGSVSSQLSPFERRNNCRVVRYGDVVAFNSPLARNRALGVRSAPPSSSKNNHFNGSGNGHAPSIVSEEIGFYRSGLGDKEKWLVLPTKSGLDTHNDLNTGADSGSGRRDAEWDHQENVDALRIGIKVRDMESLLQNEAHNSTPSNILPEQQHLHHSLCGRLYGRAVHANEAGMAFMNIKTGSVLSIAANGTLSLDNRGRGVLNTLVIQESSHGWRLHQANTPPCPPLLAQDKKQEIFQNGTYLLHPNRHDTHFAKHGIQSLLGYPVPLQESILIREVLSAMLGLEGHFIQFVEASSNCKTNDRKEDHNVWAMSQFHFALKCDSSEMDPTLYNTMQHILPMCTGYVRVNEFVETRTISMEYGLIAQAMAAAISSLLQQEYLSFVCQMEQLYQQGTLTLTKLWSLIQPSSVTMRILVQITQIARHCKGGKLLSTVCHLALVTMDGEERARQLVFQILHEASQPYMRMMRSWIYEGTMYDPYEEFVVQCTNPATMTVRSTRPDNMSSSSQRTTVTATAWDECYQLHPNNFFLLNAATARKVLQTGKYLYVIRECSPKRYDALVEHNKTLAKRLQLTDLMTGSLTLSDHIDQACSKAEMTLLKLMWQDFRLMECLQFIRRFLLMDQGDFFVQFLDLAEHELLLPVKKVSKGRIQSLLALSIQLSSPSDAPRKDNLDLSEDEALEFEAATKGLSHGDLVCKFEHNHLIDQLDAIHTKSGGIVHGPAAPGLLKTPSRHAYGMAGGPSGEGGGLRGIEALTLDCKVNWPLSLILSREAMTSYRLLFRHLFFSKYVERRLFGTWLDHQMLKGLNLRAHLGKTYMLRQRMLHFTQNFVYYMMFEVIEPHWLLLTKNLSNVRIIDSLVEEHSTFQTDIMQECLLTNVKLLSALAKLMTTCLNFSDQMRLFAQKTEIVS